jgi:phosphocarrier protein HPr
MRVGRETREVEIVNRHGLHARPAMQLVETASRFDSAIEVSNGAISVDAKSIMAVLTLAATKGTTLEIVADGNDAADAVAALVDLIADGFGSYDEDVAEG